jgi:hypothetical protein
MEACENNNHYKMEAHGVMAIVLSIFHSVMVIVLTICHGVMVIVLTGFLVDHGNL